MQLGATLAVVLNGAYALYAGLLLIAAVTDIWRFFIPNLVSLTLIVLLVVLGIYLGAPLTWWGLHLGAGALLLVAGYLAWMLGLFGAGDVKLLAAVGMYAGVGQVHRMLLYIALAGGALAIALIVLRRAVTLATVSLRARPEAVALPRVLLERERVPYGVAIAAGAILAGYDLMPGLRILG